ncbi:MAG: AMP-binding protein, partial [Phycisphaeraceae bacterium]|nr:AMP-binding protein [Phycisphaeraceae bacterium]
MSGEGPIIEDGQGTAAAGGGEDLSIPDLFAGVVRRHRDRVAVRTSAERWSYGELDERSGVVAARLVERGVSASEPVAVLLEHAPPLVAGIMGVLRAGGMYVCLDPADTSVRHQAVLAEARPRWLVTDAEHEPAAVTLMGGRAGVINLDALERTGGAIGKGDRVSGDGGAWLMYTSGSTGRPKGVWQSHRNVIHHTRVYTELAGIGEEDCLSMLASAGVAASATAFFGALLHGASLAMFSVRREGVEPLAGWLDEQGVTICHLAPSVFRRLAQVPGGPGRWSRMRVLRLGGEAVLRSDVELYRGACPDGCRLMHALSSTETGLISHLMIDKASAVGEGIVPVGRPVAGVEVMILDEAGRLCEEIGREGRITVRSRHLAMGYWRQPELTAATFECVPGRAGVRQFVGGDVGRVLEDGSLEHLGRTDRQVKVRGWRVDLGAVEAAILATGRVAEAAVVARKDDHGETRLTAYVVPAPGQKPGRTAWREVLGEGVASPMMPHTFIEMLCLPQSGSGKIDRAALAAMPATGVEHRPRGAPPRDHIERKVAEIWEAVLGVRGLGLD